QTCGAQPLPGKQAVEHQAAGYALVVLEQQAGLLEQALLAGDVLVEDDVGRRQQAGDAVHANCPSATEMGDLQGGVRPCSSTRLVMSWSRTMLAGGSRLAMRFMMGKGGRRRGALS